MKQTRNFEIRKKDNRMCCLKNNIEENNISNFIFPQIKIRPCHLKFYIQMM